MTGIGTGSGGLIPCGVGVPVLSDALVQEGYQQSTTGAVSSVEIDPETLDFVLDDYGNEIGMGDDRQRVFLCLRTLQGARMSFPTFGFKRPPKITDDVKTEVAEAVRVAMLPVLNDGSVSLLDVQTEVDGTRLFALVVWQSNRVKGTQAQAQTTKVPF